MHRHRWVDYVDNVAVGEMGSQWARVRKCTKCEKRRPEWPRRHWLIALTFSDYSLMGRKFPRGYGVAWRDFAMLETTLMPVPFNKLARLVQWVYGWFIRWQPNRWERQWMELYAAMSREDREAHTIMRQSDAVRAFDQGVEEGKRRAHTDVLRELLRNEVQRRVADGMCPVRGCWAGINHNKLSPDDEHPAAHHFAADPPPPDEVSMMEVLGVGLGVIREDTHEG